MATGAATGRIPKTLSFRDDEKPYVENVHGRLEPKMSPKRIHGKLEWRLAAWLDAWGGDVGEAAVEWRCYLLRGEKRPSSLVPDVAYMSYERLPRDLPDDARERPRIAPDIVVEIGSPGDHEKTMREKVALQRFRSVNSSIDRQLADLENGPGAKACSAESHRVTAVYFAHGTRVVIVVYPDKREIAFYHGEAKTTSPVSGILRVPGYDDLTLDADALFRGV